MFTNPEINAADAFVAAWLPGSQGAGVADVLVAGADGTAAKGFTGKLPFAWPADARSPVKTPQFAVGYGLTYAAKSQISALPEALGIDVAAMMHGENFFAHLRGRAPWPCVQANRGSPPPLP